MQACQLLHEKELLCGTTRSHGSCPWLRWRAVRPLRNRYRALWCRYICPGRPHWGGCLQHRPHWCSNPHLEVETLVIEETLNPKLSGELTESNHFVLQVSSRHTTFAYYYTVGKPEAQMAIGQIF